MAYDAATTGCITECTQSVGRLLITVDLEPAELISSTGVFRGIHEVGHALIDGMDFLGIPATWAIAEPATSSKATRLWSSRIGHDVALLGEPNWVGSRVGRGLFARELSRRIGQAEALGKAIRSFVPRDILVDESLDLLVQHGISAVRGMIDIAGRARHPAKPHPLYFGLWEIPGSLQLPGTRRFVLGGGRGYTARSQIASAVERGGLCHLVVDLPRLAEAGRMAVWTLSRTLCFAARLHRKGRLEIVTMEMLADLLSDASAHDWQQSLIRSAA
ncbi:MAG: hypothetical protein JW829_05695 [Pirellulales bacterium]|nr:hypothetical protein [Pirellulales bacterium]